MRYGGGDVAGFACLWRAPSGHGVIEDVYVHPDHRGNAVATGLLPHAVATLRSAGASRIGIAAEVGDTPGRLYVNVGFRPRRVVRSCLAPEADGPVKEM